MKIRCLITSIVSVALLIISQSVSQSAEETSNPVAAPTEEIHAKIADIDAQMARLEAKKEALAKEAERLSEQQNDLTAMQDESRERIKNTENEIRELAESNPETPAAKAQTMARLEHLKNGKAIDAGILAVKTAKEFAQAQQLQEKLAAMEMKWDMITGPVLEIAKTLESMEADLAENASSQTKKTILLKYRKLAEMDAVARGQELDLAKQRLAREKEMNALAESFGAGE